MKKVTKNSVTVLEPYREVAGRSVTSSPVLRTMSAGSDGVMTGEVGRCISSLLFESDICRLLSDNLFVCEPILEAMGGKLLGYPIVIEPCLWCNSRQMKNCNRNTFIFVSGEFRG